MAERPTPNGADNSSFSVRPIDTQTEPEPLPKVVLVFSGNLHKPLNAQAAEEIGTTIVSYFDDVLGPKTIFLEDSEGTQSKIANRKKIINEYGYLYWLTGAVISGELGHAPTPSMVNDRIARIEEGTLKQALDRKLLPESTVQEYHIARVLDDAQRQVGFKFDWESHDQAIHQRYQQAIAAGTQLTSAFNHAWQQGDFDTALSAYRQNYELQVTAVNIRDDDIVDAEKSRVRAQSKSNDGGRTIYVIGAQHYPIPFRVAQKLGPTAPVAVVSNHTEKLATPYMGAGLGLREGKQVSDETYAQAVIESYIDNTVEYEARRRGMLADFALQWETITKQVGRVAESLPLARIRQLCERREPVLPLIQGHPVAPNAQTFIS